MCVRIYFDKDVECDLECNKFGLF